MIEFLVYLAGVVAAWYLGWGMGSKNAYWKGYDYWRKLDAKIRQAMVSFVLRGLWIWPLFWWWCAWWMAQHHPGGSDPRLDYP